MFKIKKFILILFSFSLFINASHAMRFVTNSIKELCTYCITDLSSQAVEFLVPIISNNKNSLTLILAYEIANRANKYRIAKRLAEKRKNFDKLIKRLDELYAKLKNPNHKSSLMKYIQALKIKRRDLDISYVNIYTEEILDSMIFILHKCYDIYILHDKHPDYQGKETAISSTDAQTSIDFINSIKNDFIENAQFINDKSFEYELDLKSEDYFSFTSHNQFKISHKFVQRAIGSEKYKAQLYGILAHEMGHKQHRHLELPIKLLKNLNFALPDSLKIYVLLNTHGILTNYMVINILLIDYLPALLVKFIYGAYSRKQEFQADEFSAKSFNGKYIDGLIDRLENIREKYRKNDALLLDNKWYCMLTASTHPSPSERIKKLKAIQSKMAPQE